MKRGVQAQQNLEVVMSALLPLLPFVSGKRCREATLRLLELLKEAVEREEMVSERAAKLKALSPVELRDFFTSGTAPKKRRKGKSFSLSAVDIWADRKESVHMVAALSWWCDVIVMREAVRAILANDDERSEIAWGEPVDGRILERWYRLYCKIPGLKRSPKRSVFVAVVNSFVTSHPQARIVWSGQSGKGDCEAAECDQSACDGRHMGLRVQCDDEGAFAVTGQMGICYNPKDLEKWKAAPGTPSHKDPSARIDLIRKFLESSDNVFELRPRRHTYMVGLWGLVEHGCDSSALNFEQDRVIQEGDSTRLKQRTCQVQVISGSCEFVSKRGFCTWNYGQEFIVHIECQCFLCK